MNFDYPGWQQAPARGLRGGNHNFLMGALFYDQDWREDLAVYVLGTEEYTTPGGRVLPSAYQIVTNAIDEYDAMKKLVGNLEQWDRLKELEWFSSWLERALREQLQRQISKVRTAMLWQALEGDNTAARTVLAIDKQMNTKPVGRPKGKRNEDPKKPKTDNAADAGRISQFRR